MFATALFLVLGFVGGWWHPAWVVFPVGGIICHEQSGFGFGLFEFQDRVEILRRLGQQFQIGADIGLCVELVFRQEHRKLGLCAGQGRQRFFVQRVGSHFPGGGKIIRQYVIGQPVLPGEAAAVEGTYGGQRVLGGSADGVGVGGTASEGDGSILDPVGRRVLKGIMKGNRTSGNFLAE